MLTAPTEPDALRALGQTSPVPETFGVDYLWSSRGQLHGAQRKEFGDLISSVQGGGTTGERLAKESMQAKRLATAFLIVEGTPHWTADGQLIDNYRRFSRRQYRMLLVALSHAGFRIVHTDDITDTAGVLADLQGWTAKEHTSLLSRPNPVSPWGRPDNGDFRLWFWQSFPGIGPTQAKALDEHFGGRLPFTLDVGWDELRKVKGMGPKRVAGIRALFERVGEKVS